MNKKEHFWIPDEEVDRREKRHHAQTKPRNISYREHGAKLSRNLQSVKESFQQTASSNSLSESDILIFNVELPTSEKVKDKVDLFNKNGMSIKAVKNTNNAIVASTKDQFQNLQDRIEQYTKTGYLKSQFDYVEEIKPYTGSEKNSSQLNKIIMDLDDVPKEIDLQLMLIPNLDNSVYAKAIKKLHDKIEANGGSILNDAYYLSDKTPVIRAIIPSSSISIYENDQAIYRIEETDF